MVRLIHSANNEAVQVRQPRLWNRHGGQRGDILLIASQARHEEAQMGDKRRVCAARGSRRIMLQHGYPMVDVLDLAEEDGHAGIFVCNLGSLRHVDSVSEHSAHL